MAHPLTKFLEARKMTQAKFADMAGLHRTVIAKLCSGARKSVGTEAARKIVKATRRKITYEQLLGTGS